MSNPSTMLRHFKTLIVARFPELRDASFTLLTQGWDAIAVDVDDRLIFKFPRQQDGTEALRREAAMLAVVRPVLTLPVPELAFFDTPRPFSKHIKLKGEQLVTAQYEVLSSGAKQKLAEDIARFYAELHAIDPALLQAAGALPLDPWPAPDRILEAVKSRLDNAHLKKATKTLAQWEHLAADPYGITYGFFHGHSWNMAFDHQHQQLNGMYDFGDAGFGELHQEFIYTSFISPALTGQVITAYEQFTGRGIDRGRVWLLTGVLFLVELAELGEDADHGALVLQNALSWLSES